MSKIHIHFHPTDFESTLPAAFGEFRKQELDKLEKINEQTKVVIEHIDIRLEQNQHLGDHTYTITINLTEEHKSQAFSAVGESKDYQDAVRIATHKALSFVFKEKSKLADHHN